MRRWEAHRVLAPALHLLSEWLWPSDVTGLRLPVLLHKMALITVIAILQYCWDYQRKFEMNIWGVLTFPWWSMGRGPQEEPKDSPLTAHSYQGPALLCIVPWTPQETELGPRSPNRHSSWFHLPNCLSPWGESNESLILQVSKLPPHPWQCSKEKNKKATLRAFQDVQVPADGGRTRPLQLRWRDTWHISRWSNLKSGMCRKDCLTFPWSRSENLHVRGAFPLPGRKGRPYLWKLMNTDRKAEWTGLTNFPQFTVLSSWSLSCHIFPHLPPLYPA